MYWKDEGYLLSKNNFNENSIIIEAFTIEHGKYTGIVYGGSSSKHKKKIQIGNKILLNWKSKGENRPGYFDIELIEAVSPKYFDDKKRSISILAATSILKILLPERQINKKIYYSFDCFIENLSSQNWIKSYILWEFALIKELGFEVVFINNNKFIEINGKNLPVPEIIVDSVIKNLSNDAFREALSFNKNLIMEYFIIPNKLKLPTARNILEKYFN